MKLSTVILIVTAVTAIKCPQRLTKQNVLRLTMGFASIKCYSRFLNNFCQKMIYRMKPGTIGYKLCRRVRPSFGHKPRQRFSGKNPVLYWDWTFRRNRSPFILIFHCTLVYSISILFIQTCFQLKPLVSSSQATEKIIKKTINLFE